MNGWAEPRRAALLVAIEGWRGAAHATLTRGEEVVRLRVHVHGEVDAHRALGERGHACTRLHKPLATATTWTDGARAGQGPTRMHGDTATESTCGAALDDARSTRAHDAAAVQFSSVLRSLRRARTCTSRLEEEAEEEEGDGGAKL